MAKFALFSILFLGLLSYSYGAGHVHMNANWETFKAHHHKTYPNAGAEAKAKANFELNKAAITEHNRKHGARQGHVHHRQELNEYADQHPDDFVAQRTGFIKKRIQINNQRRSIEARPVRQVAPPLTFDWRLQPQNPVTGVKNQGQCGCCWAFSATGGIESQLLMQNLGNSSWSGSEEQLADCDHGQNGCNGGDYLFTYNYIKQNGGIMTESAYPFTAGSPPNQSPAPGPGSCQFNANSQLQQVSGFGFIEDGAVVDIQNALTTYGPLSVGLNADQTWMGYMGAGYLTGSNMTLNHAVLLIGWGSSTGAVSDYWIIKNQWGISQWGNQGFGYVNMTVGYDCGIRSRPAFPQLPNVKYPTANNWILSPPVSIDLQ